MGSVKTYPIVLGTAGHIDHGKTALVRALTGIDTDRLKVEKERGITTELGFAHLDLGEQRFGVVDVPGHERFIKAMVAGAGGLDLVCLVIAADEGVMPQTREHLDICELLGVRRGVVALSKRDLVDDEWIAMVSEEIRGYLADSFLAEAAIVPVSAKTGAGLDELRAELLRITRQLPARSAAGALRLPIDRVFTIKGFGTVVTGTILGGTVRAGETVVVHPRGQTAKVRGVELHGEAAGEALAGMRCAVNQSGLGTGEVARGELLSHPGAVTPSHLLDARFRYLRTSRAPLSRRTRVLLHHATAQLMATLVLVDRDTLEPGDEALVQLRLDATTPVAALPGDHFIARGFVLQEHYGTTLGGGEIVRVQAPKVRPSSAAAAADTLRRMADADLDQRVALEVRSVEAAGLGAAELGRRLGHAAGELGAALARLVETGDLVRAGDDDDAAVYCHAEPFARLEKQALDHLDAFHRDQPHKEGMSREELRARLPGALPPRLYEALLAALVRRGAVQLAADLVRRARAAAADAAGAAQSPLERQVAERFRAWALTPPRPKDVAAEVGADERATRAALERLLARGAIVRVRPDLYVDRAAVDALQARLLSHLDAHGQITAPQWKELAGTTRKYAIPLAEHFDATKVTLRIGDIRKKRG